MFKTSGLKNKESICVAWGAESMNLNAIYVLFKTFGWCVIISFLSFCLLHDIPVLCGSIHFHNYNGLYCILTFLFILSWVTHAVYILLSQAILSYCNVNEAHTSAYLHLCNMIYFSCSSYLWGREGSWGIVFGTHGSEYGTPWYYFYLIFHMEWDFTEVLVAGTRWNLLWYKFQAHPLHGFVTQIVSSYYFCL